VKKLINKVLRTTGYELHRVDRGYQFNMLLNELRNQNDSSLASFFRFALPHVQRSYAQLFQDLFVLFTLGEKRDGYFVEFGAADGLRDSNSALLEREYGWHGILAEPSPHWSEALGRNRTCELDLRCVWNSTGEKLRFSQTCDRLLSTISSFRKSDRHDRSDSSNHEVETISLHDLLRQHKAPREIDYLSVDTEGSELQILRALDFRRWRFKVITVEHNFVQEKRTAICALLNDRGYRRVFSEFSGFDDWYVVR
jgi:FkbM family methyltransferase